MTPWGFPDQFTVEPPKTDVFAPSGGWSSAVSAPWVEKQETKTPEYANDENLKNQFGIEWAKAGKPWEAACKVFEADTTAALWIASNWINDPVVIAAKDVYLKTVKAKKYLLDRDEFAAMLLERADRMGDEKEEVSLLKLYADVRGFLNKDTTTNNFINNEGLKVLVVKAPPVEPTALKPVSNVKSEILNDGPLPIKIKLVGSG